MALLLLVASAVALRLAAKWSAVIVDARLEPGVVASITNARRHMPAYVPIYLMTSEAHRSAASAFLAQYRNVRLADARYEHRGIQSYNDLLMSTAFWEQFAGDEYVLVFQSDSRFCSGSANKTLLDFVGRWDYIGAPWETAARGLGTRVGNGGFSLRSRQLMLDCIRTRKRSWYHEDVFFALCAKDRGARVPSPEVAASFAVEMYRPAGVLPMAVHKSWHYIHDDLALARHCPEGVRLVC